MAFSGVRELHRLARLHGVQTAYYDIRRVRRTASTEALAAVLRCLGVPIERVSDAPGALRQERRARLERVLDPVVVAWGDDPAAAGVRLPDALAGARISCTLELEDGEVRGWGVEVGRARPGRRAAAGRSVPASGDLDRVEHDGARFLAGRIGIPGRVPPGYHRLKLEVAGGIHECRVIGAPKQAFDPFDRQARAWGVFLPLHALRTSDDWGVGDLSGLDALGEWVSGLGGRVVGTLPLLAAYLDEPLPPLEASPGPAPSATSAESTLSDVEGLRCDPSPYSPVSRLFWNELFVDPARAPGAEGSDVLRELRADGAAARELAELRALPRVDYRRAAALRRRVLGELARAFFDAGGEASAGFRRFARGEPRLRDYARFRAAVDARRAAWPGWPEPLRSGRLPESDREAGAVRYHMYVQWAAHLQLEALSHARRAADAALYLDLPLGVRQDGYDVWRERRLFVTGVSAGAPPDPFFTGGQNWGFPPMDPSALRDDGYRYFGECLRNHMRYAGALRLDHVMGLHRLYWIPQGMDARQGVYVRYPAEDLYAVLALESHRHGTLVIGEDLGTVPREVRSAMNRHGVQRMYVVQFALGPGEQPLERPSARTVASLNTHDMPPFAAYWGGLDIRDRVALGLLDEAEAEETERTRERIRRDLVAFLRREQVLGDEASAETVMRACLAFLAGCPARLLLVSLEDLWLETEQQNTPGTLEERVNWRRKARYALEEMREMARVVGALRDVDRIRRGG